MHPIVSSGVVQRAIISEGMIVFFGNSVSRSKNCVFYTDRCEIKIVRYYIKRPILFMILRYCCFSSSGKRRISLACELLDVSFAI